MYFPFEQEDGIILHDINLKKYITKYYDKLFGASKNNSVSTGESYRDDIPQVSTLENEMLVALFFEDEVREAIF